MQHNEQNPVMRPTAMNSSLPLSIPKPKAKDVKLMSVDVDEHCGVSSVACSSSSGGVNRKRGCPTPQSSGPQVCRSHTISALPPHHKRGGCAIARRPKLVPSSPKQSKRPRLDTRVVGSSGTQRCRLGINSITPTNTLDMVTSDRSDFSRVDTGPQSLTKYAGNFQGPIPGFLPRLNNDGFEIFTHVGSSGGLYRQRVQERVLTHAQIPRAAQQPFSYIRIVFNISEIGGAIDPTTAPFIVEGTPDPSKLTNALQGRVPFTRRMGDGLASLLNVGLHFRDNTSLYMKGMFIALLHARLTELGAPIHYPDLANVPVRYMMIDDSQQYQAQPEVIRSTVQEGVFVLLDGLEWMFMLQQYYHYLLLVGLFLQ